MVEAAIEESLSQWGGGALLLDRDVKRGRSRHLRQDSSRSRVCAMLEVSKILRYANGVEKQRCG